MALKHHLGIAKTQIERLHFVWTIRTINLLQLIDKSESGTHGIIIIAIGSKHDDEVGTSVDILPEILGRRILDSYDTTEVLDALIHLSHLEIGYTTIAIGTYRREFAYFGQTIGNSKKMLKVASKPGSQRDTVAMCAY